MSKPTPKEIRERFSDYSNEWEDIRDEARIDMRYVLGDPWDPEDRKAREDAGRPCISLDEINQYLNQYINNLRANKRAIQIAPTGNGANDKLATSREDVVRGIEYRSNAQAAYVTGGENAVMRSYGFAELTTVYANDQAEDGPAAFDQEIRIAPIPNPDTVTLDPDYKQADASDVEHAFKTDLLRLKDYKRKYRGMATVSFSADQKKDASQWIRENYIQIAAFWQINKTQRELLLIDGGENGPIAEWADKLKGKKGFQILKSRKVEKREVMQYLTNGVEIIDEVPWAGSRIPILACFGKELFVDDGSGSQRKLISMVRLARDPQMLHAFYASQEAEEAGMSPKTPYVGYKGQFESDRETWEELAKVPHAFVQVDPYVDAASGQLLPLPERTPFVPNFEAYELAKEAAKRSIQSAMGISPQPTDMQRDNLKSGVALERIETSEAVGSFHFSDNYDRFLQNAGWQINELIPIIYDTARDVPIHKADGKTATMRLNDREYEVQNPGAPHLDTSIGKYDTTVSTAPSHASQRQAAEAFVDLLLTNLQTLPIPPETATKILALGIKMKTLGAIGDQIAELLDPPTGENLPPQVRAAMQQLQGQIQMLTQENAALHMERAGKVLEQKTKVQIEGMRGQTTLDEAHINAIVRLAVAEITKQSKADDGQARADVQTELAQLSMKKDIVTMAHASADQQAAAAVGHERAKDLATHQVAIQPAPNESKGPLPQTP